LSRTIRELTAAIASGDTEAFGVFYEQWFDHILLEARLASRRDEQFCLDLVQDTMMRVIRSMKTFDHEDGLRRWLRVVVQTCCIDLFRAESRRRRREHSHQSLAGHAEYFNEHDERLVWLESQLAALEPDDAKLLDMRFRFGWTLARIASTLGLSTGAVDGRLNRLLAALRGRAKGMLP